MGRAPDCLHLLLVLPNGRVLWHTHKLVSFDRMRDVIWEKREESMIITHRWESPNSSARNHGHLARHSKTRTLASSQDRSDRLSVWHTPYMYVRLSKWWYSKCIISLIKDEHACDKNALGEMRTRERAVSGGKCKKKEHAKRDIHTESLPFLTGLLPLYCLFWSSDSQLYFKPFKIKTACIKSLSVSLSLSVYLYIYICM